MPGVRSSSRRKAPETKEAPPTKRGRGAKAADKNGEKAEDTKEETVEEVEEKTTSAKKEEKKDVKSGKAGGGSKDASTAAKGKGRGPVKVTVEHCKS